MHRRTILVVLNQLRKALGGRFTILAAAILTSALWAASAGPAAAHGVYIFAWADGDQICTDSYFSKSSKVRGGRVSMRNAAGEILAAGLTGDDGGLCLARPEARMDLFFVVEAGEGHRAEFKLRAEDLPGDAPAASEPAAPEAARPPSSAAGKVNAATTEDSLRQIIREELQSQLSPIRKTLAEGRHQQEPGPREIIGGLGWVAGLFGLAFWWTGRKKK